MANLYLTLVTGSSLTLTDLGNYIIPSGTADMPVSQIADDDEISESTSWSASLAAGEFTLADISGDVVTEVIPIGNTSNTFYGVQTYIGPVTGSSFTGSFVGEGNKLTSLCDRQQAYVASDSTTSTSTYDSIAGATLTTANLGGNGDYLVTFSYSWENDDEGGDEHFFIFEQDGSEVAHSETIDTNNGEDKQNSSTFSYLFSDIPAGTIFSVSFKTDDGTLILLRGKLIINGVPTTSNIS